MKSILGYPHASKSANLKPLSRAESHANKLRRLLEMERAGARGRKGAVLDRLLAALSLTASAIRRLNGSNHLAGGGR